MVQILFSKDDKAGGKSSLVENFWHLDYKKNRASPGNWGSDRQILKSKTFPRGKAYDRLHTIQLSAAYSEL